MKYLTLGVILLSITACACKTPQSVEKSELRPFYTSDNEKDDVTPCLTIGKEGSSFVLRVIYET